MISTFVWLDRGIQILPWTKSTFFLVWN
jgi:hypothetical protein